MSLQPTPNQLSVDGLQNNLLLNAINSPDKIPFTWDISNHYNLIEMLIYLKGRKPRPVSGTGGAIQKPIMGISRVIAQVLTRTLNADGTLTLTFTNTTYNLFRLKQVCLDGTPSSNAGRCIATAPGTITLEPDGAISAAGGYAVVTSAFPVGGYVLAAWDNSGFYDSAATQSMYETPFYVTDLVATHRESLTLRLADFFKTYTTYDGGFWANGQEMFAYNRMNQAKIRNWYFSKFGTFQSGNEGTVNYSMGIRQAVMDQYRGGYYQNFTNPLTQNDWENWLTTTADLQSISGGDTTLNICMGREMLRRIQSFTAPYIQFGGNTNTFGGSSVKGLDVRNYSYAGINANLYLDPVLNDIPSYPTGSAIAGVVGTIRQNTCFAIDLADYQPAGGGGVLPAFEELYWQELGQSTIFGYEPGLIGMSQKMGSDIFSKASTLATNDSPSAKLHIFDMSGPSLIANRCGWLEPAA